jgi:hypothetical protein
MSSPAIDYNALAAQHGAISSEPDYDALAKKHGAISPDGGGGPAPESFLGGAWKNLNPIPILKSISESATSPAGMIAGPGGVAVDLARKHLPGIISAMEDQAAKAKDAYHRGAYSEAAGHALATLLPGVGPAAADAAETMGGSEAQYDKFGNITQPAVAPNLAGGAGEAAGLVAPFLVKPGMQLAGKAANAAGVPEALQGSAEKSYAQVLNPTTKVNKAITAKIVPELLDRGVTALTMKGLQAQAQSHIAAVGSAIGDAWDALPAGTKTDLQPVYDHLQSAIDDTHSIPDSAGKMIPKGPEAERAIDNISRLQQTLVDVAEPDASGKLQIPVDKIRDLRQYFDGIAAKAGRYPMNQLSDQSAAEAHGLAADSIRKELANDHPDIAELNKEYSFWKNTNQVVSDTLERRQGQAKPLGRQLASAAGAGAGFVSGGVGGAVLGRAAMDAIESATRSPAWRTVSAVLKSKLADAIASGKPNAIQFASEQVQRAAMANSAMETEQPKAVGE